MTIYNVPEIDDLWNALVRDYDDREFRFGMTTGLDGPTVVHPATYRLEITPDLGFNSIPRHFTPADGENGNGLLVTIEGLVAGDDIELVGDGSGIYTVPIDTMKRIVAPGYPRYIWRVVPVSGDGQDWTASAVQSFRGRIVVHDDSWTLVPPAPIARAPSVTLHGTRSTNLVAVEVNDSEVWTTYPSSTTWRAVVPLTPGRNTLLVRALDSKGNPTSYKRADVDLHTADINDSSYFNRFDDFGYMLGLERLPDERNQAYRRRLQDVFVHRAGPSYSGVVLGATREVGATYDDAAITLRAARTVAGPRRQDVRVWATSTWIYVATSDMVVVREYAEIPGNSWRVQLGTTPVIGGVKVEQPLGTEIKQSAWKLDEDTIQFLDPELLASPVYITYSYAVRVPLADRTLAEVVQDLNAISIGGSDVVDATLSSRRSGTEDAEGILAFQPVQLEISPNKTVGGVILNEMPIRWSAIKVQPLLENDFVRRYYQGSGHIFGTRYAGLANRLKRELRTTWGYLIADEGVWAGVRIRPSGIGRLPTCFDPDISAWRHTSNGPSYSTREAWGRGFYSPFDDTILIMSGVSHEAFRSGIGADDDLMVVVKDHGSFEDDPGDPFEIRYTVGDFEPIATAELST